MQYRVCTCSYLCGVCVCVSVCVCNSYTTKELELKILLYTLLLYVVFRVTT